MRLSERRLTTQRSIGTLGIDSAGVTQVTSKLSITYYSTLDSLPSTGTEDGDRAFVNENRRLYVADDGGWYNASLVNLSPSIDSIDGPLALARSNSYEYTVIATDSDNNISSYTYTLDPPNVTDSAISFSSDSSTFSITTTSPDSGSIVGFSVTATASDGINTDNETISFSIPANYQAIQRNVTAYHIGSPPAFGNKGLPTIEILPGLNQGGLGTGELSRVIENLQAAIDSGNAVTSHTFPSSNPAYGYMYLTLWDSSSAVYVSRMQRTDNSFVFPTNIFTYDPDSAGGSDGIYGVGGGSVGVLDSPGVLYATDTHYHVASQESIDDSNLKAIGFSQNGYAFSASSVSFNDGGGATTYYHDVGTAGSIHSTSTTGSAPSFREIRLYAETANTNNLMWSAPIKW